MASPQSEMKWVLAMQCLLAVVFIAAGLVVSPLSSQPPPTTAAQESVKLKGSNIVYRGTILRYDDVGVSIRWGSRNEVKEFTIDQIDTVTANWPAAFLQGKKLLDQGKFPEAVAELRSALAGEERQWAQEHIRNDLLRGLRAVGEVDATADMFVKVISGRRDNAIMAFAPLRWLPGRPLSEQQHKAAKSWLIHGDHPAVKFLGANWLLGTADDALARASIEQLRTDPDSRIRPLARAILIADLLAKNPKAFVKEDLAEFRKEVFSLAYPVRIGPQYVLGKAYEAANDYPNAALAYLTIPYVLGGPPDLQAEAMRDAARCCDKAKLTDDALKIRAEIAKRFPEDKPVSRGEKTSN